MLYLFTFISFIIVISVVLPLLLKVAFFTLADRKVMASMHRRLGPNIVGTYGFLQPFADALKLLLKEYILPALANKILFTLGPYLTLVFSLLSSAVICYGPGLSIWDFSLGIIYMLATYSLSTYGVLLSGWSANSKYAFLGSLRSTAQLISYELVLTSAILLTVLMWGSFNFTTVTESQKSVWSVWPLAPIFYIFFKTCVAETNRAPFDLAEAESELVSGYMTEHAAAIFVSFFLGEYSSITLICIFISILFLGGYLFSIKPILNVTNHMLNIIYKIHFILYYKISQFLPYKKVNFDPVKDGLLSSYSLGFKAALLIFAFIWIRASYPRIRFDQLMSYCWTILLPIVIAFIIIIPCTLYGLEIIPTNDILFSSLFFTKRFFSSSSTLAVKRTREDYNETEGNLEKKIKLEEDGSFMDDSESKNSSRNGSPMEDSKSQGSAMDDSESQGSLFDSSVRSPSMEFTSPGKITSQSFNDNIPDDSPAEDNSGDNNPDEDYSGQNNPSEDKSSESGSLADYDGDDPDRLEQSAIELNGTVEWYNEVESELRFAKEYQERLNKGETLTQGELWDLKKAKEEHFNPEITEKDKTYPEVFDMQMLENKGRVKTIKGWIEDKLQRAQDIRDQPISSSDSEDENSSQKSTENPVEAINPETNPNTSNVSTTNPNVNPFSNFFTSSSSVAYPSENPAVPSTAETVDNTTDTNNPKSGSLLDDYADPSTQPGDFFGGDD